MSKGSYIPRTFWDSGIWSALKSLDARHLRVFLHLAHGPASEVSGLSRISVAQIAEDCDLDPDEVRQTIEELTSTGWCEYEPPLIWIIGNGNINDRLGTKDFRANPSWLRATEKHLDSLPDNPLIDAFRRYHGIMPVKGRVSTGCGQGADRVFSSLHSVSPSADPAKTPDAGGDL